MEGKKINWMHILASVAISVVVSIAIMHFTKVVNAAGVDTGDKLSF